MTTATNLLNAIAAELNTNDKETVINVALAMIVKTGVSIPAAFDLLLGEGAYDRFSGQVASYVYDKLRAA